MRKKEMKKGVLSLLNALSNSCKDARNSLAEWLIKNKRGIGTLIWETDRSGDRRPRWS